MKIAIMQPYFFPYIGYFQLINAVDKFVFYDDVHYVKRGWINRNNILIGGKVGLINAEIKKASQNKLILETEIHSTDFSKLLRTIDINYKRAPYHKNIFPLLIKIFNFFNGKTISELNIHIIRALIDYLEIKTTLEISSYSYGGTFGLEKSKRLIAITQLNNYQVYINAIGGRKIYSKETFKEKGIDLFFLQTDVNGYKQYEQSFEPNLSIIDVMMFNHKDKVRGMLNDYVLV